MLFFLLDEWFVIVDQHYECCSFRMMWNSTMANQKCNLKWPKELQKQPSSLCTLWGKHFSESSKFLPSMSTHTKHLNYFISQNCYYPENVILKNRIKMIHDYVLQFVEFFICTHWMLTFSKKAFFYSFLFSSSGSSIVIYLLLLHCWLITIR